MKAGKDLRVDRDTGCFFFAQPLANVAERHLMQVNPFVPFPAAFSDATQVFLSCEKPVLRRKRRRGRERKDSPASGAAQQRSPMAARKRNSRYRDRPEDLFRPSFPGRSLKSLAFICY